MKLAAWLVAIVAWIAVPASAADDPHAPIQCRMCVEWNAPQRPFRVFGNTYYVGVHGLSSVLIAGKDGLILLDGALPQSARRIEANIRALGFRVEDVRYIASSHAHYDHAGGIAALARDSGARVLASRIGAAALESGRASPDDPQAGFGEETRFPPVASVQGIADGETVRLGELAIAAVYTPGHTPGATSWTWRSCEGERCLDLVYADSLMAVAAPDYRFSDLAHPERVETLRRSIARVRALPCDVLLTVHPELSSTLDKPKRRAADGHGNPFIDPEACKAYADGATRLLDRRLAEEAR